MLTVSNPPLSIIFTPVPPIHTNSVTTPHKALWVHSSIPGKILLLALATFAVKNNTPTTTPWYAGNIPTTYYPNHAHVHMYQHTVLYPTVYLCREGGREEDWCTYTYWDMCTSSLKYLCTWSAYGGLVN